MATAAQKAMALPELLENVLQHLEPTQLFIVQRVNATFKKTISESKTLRRCMFLEPCVVDEAAPPPTPAKWDFDEKFELVFEDMDETVKQRMDTMLNPLLRKGATTSMPFYQLHIVNLGYGCEMFAKTEYEVICIAEANRKIADIKADEQSWRRMTLTKNGLGAEFRVFCDSDAQIETVTFTVDGTTELGRVADVISDLHARCQLGTLEGQGRRWGGDRTKYRIAGVEVVSWYDLS
ncbi:hypothetical protein LTR36_006656 [Oleoguttula mirabilis]|uniref:F-box domain-containing protein n=1 Tax=Oleoguttula mirabilis TaxID=1507867 RepID=A0AAV9JC03_9PEZI|nr:hypothetical protein LTR36_006656 [Oleoguttula mirabilis]